MKNIQNGQDKKQNDSFNFNFTNNNDQDKIEVNMFTSIRKDSMNFDEINKNLNCLSNLKNPDSNNEQNNKKDQNISPIIEQKQARPKSKQLKLTPLDPKLYRINFEDFNQKKNNLKESKLPRLSSAQIRINKDSMRKENSSNVRSSVISTIKKSQLKPQKNNLKFVSLSKEKRKPTKKMQNDKEKVQNNQELTSRKAQNEIEEKEEEDNIVIEDFKSIKVNNLIDKEVVKTPPIIEQKEKCIFCLSNLINPVTLQCNHKICSNCLKELNILNSFQSKKSSKLLKCPQCHEVIQNYLLKEENIDFFEQKENNPQIINNQASSKCSICNNTNVKFECLNCDMLLCLKCKNFHFSFPNNQNHKYIPYHDNKISDASKCPIHKLEVEYFCVNDNIPICLKCVDVLHGDHLVKKLEEVNEHYQVEIMEQIEKGKEFYEKISNLINNLDNSYKILTNEKDFFVKKTKKMFNDMVNTLLTQQTVILNKINEFFKIKANFIEDKKTKFTLLKNRFEYFLNFNNTINQMEINEKTTLQNIQFISNLSWMNNSVFTLIPYDKLLKKISLLSFKDNSTFLYNPIKKISSSISKFTFFPLSPDSLDKLKLFFKNSNIITKELINTDLLITLPKITKCKLLYRVSRDGPSPELFHEKCNMKGPTITFIKTDNHIFGGFNSLNYSNKNEYESSDKNFLFSISDGKIRKPMRCNLIKQMKKFAIKQSEKEYSPGFGLVDNSDLFIAFKQLNNSYSRLDNVYKCPKGYNPKTFLAGKENNWNILDIEIYSIEYMDDSQFYLLEEP